MPADHAAVTTMTIGLRPSHPPVYVLRLTTAEATFEVHSSSRPREVPPEDRREDIETPRWSYEPVPRSSYRPGHAPPAVIQPVFWRQPILGYQIIEAPTPTSMAGQVRGRFARLSDEELEDLLTEHAEELAGTMGPIGFPNRLAGGHPGWSQTHLASLAAGDERITSGNERLRLIIRRVLPKVKDEWKTAHPTTSITTADGTTAEIPEGYPAFAPAESWPLFDELAAHHDARPSEYTPPLDAWRPFLRRWISDAMADHPGKPITARRVVFDEIRPYARGGTYKLQEMIDAIAKGYGDDAADPLTWAAPEPTTPTEEPTP